LAVLEVTLARKKHVAEGLKIPLDIEIVLPPAVAVTMPPQVPAVAGVDATVTPEGSATESATPLSARLLGLVSVTVTVLVPPTTMLDGLSATLAVGASGVATVTPVGVVALEPVVLGEDEVIASVVME
jgi:hypothetical protein